MLLLDVALALLVFVGCALLGVLVVVLLKQLSKEKSEDKQDR